MKNNDFVRFVCERAAEAFGGGNDGMFNAANFSVAFKNVSGTELLDGKVVRLILLGRSDIELAGNAHYRLLW